jgi:hypothetical protein
MYTTGRLEAAVYGFSEDCKQLLNLWLSWLGEGPAFAKMHRPIFYLIGFHSCNPQWESRLLQLCTIYRIKLRNPNGCTSSLGWPWVWFSPILLGPHCSDIYAGTDCFITHFKFTNASNYLLKWNLHTQFTVPLCEYI